MSDVRLQESRQVFSGAALIGLAQLFQRGGGFLATFLAARIAGPAVFGQYVFAVSTVGMLAGYLGLGVASTAVRYGGQLGGGSPSGARVRRFIWIWTLTSGFAAAGLVYFFSGSVVSLLAIGDHAQILRFAAPICIATLVFEVVWGSQLGARSNRSLLLIGATYGICMALFLPIGSTVDSSVMLLGHAIALFISVVVGIECSRRYSSRTNTAEAIGGNRPTHREMLRFGISQIVSTLGIGVASWWVVALISRVDPSMKEVGAYGVATQLKAVAVFLPGIFVSQVMPMLASSTAESSARMRVLSNMLVYSGTTALIAAGCILFILPQLITLYGPHYQHATTAIILLVACGAVQMSNGPMFQAVVLYRPVLSALIAGVGAATLATSATLLVPHFGAAGGGISWLVAESAGYWLSYLVVRRFEGGAAIRRSVVAVWLAIVVVTAAALCREWTAGSDWAGSIAIVLVTSLATLVFAYAFLKARRGGWA